MAAPVAARRAPAGVPLGAIAATKEVPRRARKAAAAGPLAEGTGGTPVRRPVRPPRLTPPVAFWPTVAAVAPRPRSATKRPPSEPAVPDTAPDPTRKDAAIGGPAGATAPVRPSVSRRREPPGEPEPARMRQQPPSPAAVRIRARPEMRTAAAATSDAVSEGGRTKPDGPAGPLTIRAAGAASVVAKGRAVQGAAPRRAGCGGAEKEEA